METTEKIVDTYCRHVKGLFTIANIRCKGQYEIDLLAVDPNARGKHRRFHIESGVSISGGFSKLTAKPYSPEMLKTRLQTAGQRRTMGYFIQRKFGAKEIQAKLKEYGFRKGNYTKVIVTWGFDDAAKKVADRAGIEIWDFREILEEIAKLTSHDKTHFTDDTLRTLQLFMKIHPFE